MSRESDIFILIDGHALIYRAYFAFPGLSDPQGRLVNAVYGFTRVLLGVIARFDPEYLAVAFDHPKPTLRHKEYEDYKAHREAMPDDLRPQVEIIKRVVEAMNMPQFEKAGYEADDLIGTAVRQVKAGDDVLSMVVTGDKDLLQLVNDHTHVFIPARGKFGKDIEYDAATVEEKMGVTPEQVPELKALMGDSSDNIPGVKGVGAKTAATLVQKFGKLEELYARLERVQQGETDDVLKGALIKKLTQDKENAYMSRELATIMTQAPLTLDLPACRVREYDKEQVWQLFDELAFDSLKELLPADDFESGIQDALF